MLECEYVLVYKLHIEVECCKQIFQMKQIDFDANHSNRLEEMGVDAYQQSVDDTVVVIEFLNSFCLIPNSNNMVIVGLLKHPCIKFLKSTN